MVGRKHKFRSRVDGHLIVNRCLQCGTYNATGGSGCTYNTIDEDDLIALLLRKLCERFLAADARQLLNEEIAAGVSEGSESRQAEIDRLRGDLPEVAARLKQAARSVLTEDEALLPALREQLKEMQGQHDKLAARLASLEAAPSPSADIGRKVERVAGRVRKLVELRHRCDPAALRVVFAEMLGCIELHFVSEPIKGGRRRSRLVRGVAHFNEDYMLVNCSK
jgi:hypothetical protein